MAYCAPHGIPYSAWLDWDDLSRAAAIAWLLRERDRCPGCGLPRSELVDEEGNALRRQPYVPEMVGCPGCQVSALKRKSHDENYKDRPWIHMFWRRHAS